MFNRTWSNHMSRPCWSLYTGYQFHLLWTIFWWENLYRGVMKSPAMIPVQIARKMGVRVGGVDRKKRLNDLKKYKLLQTWAIASSELCMLFLKKWEDWKVLTSGGKPRAPWWRWPTSWDSWKEIGWVSASVKSLILIAWSFFDHINGQATPSRP